MIVNNKNTVKAFLKAILPNNLHNDNSDELKLVKIMKNMKDCPVMTHGNKKVEMAYFFCSCDPNQKDPICEACAFKCHQGHTLTPRYDFDTYQIKQVCMCGMRCHQLNESTEVQYQPICYFHELAYHCKRFYYYEEEDSKNIMCVFCGTYCFNDEKNWTVKPKYILKLADDQDSLPKCNCPAQSHRDLKQIYNYTYHFTDTQMSIFEGLTPTHLLNLFFKSTNSFKNLYSSFLIKLNEIHHNLTNADFEFDKRLSISNFYWAIGNFAVMSKNCEELYYFDNKITEFFQTDFICKILDKKIQDNIIHFTLIQSILRGFQKMTVSPLLEFMPKLKILDFMNLSTFHRLSYAEEILKSPYLNRIFKTDSNDFIIVDSYINSFENLIRLRFDKPEGFAIILLITSLIKKFAKFYLMSYDQIIKFASLIDDLFYYITNFNKKLEKKFIKKDFNQKLMEIKIVTNVAKIFIYFCYFYNDSVFQVNIKKCQHANFINKQNELGKLVSKNMVHLINYIREEMIIKNDIHNEEDLELKNKIQKVFLISQNLISLFLNQDDAYIFILKRSLNKNCDFMTRILFYDFAANSKEDTFTGFLNIQAKSIEEKLFAYFNFNCTSENLISHITSIINSFFSSVGNRDYKSKNLISEEDEANGEQTKILKNNNINNSIPYNLLMTNSTYVFSLVKILSVESISLKLTENFINLILKNLFYFIEDQPENCVIILTKPILTSFLKIDTNYIPKVLDLILVTLRIIIKNEYKINNVYHAIKIVLAMYNKVKNNSINQKENNNDESLHSCFTKLLKIFKLFLSLETLNKQETLNQIREEMKTNFKEYKIINSYKKNLLNYNNNNNNNLTKISVKNYFKFLQLINESYDDNALKNHSQFLTQILKSKEILKILKINSLDLQLRTELIRFFRMVYIDLSIDNNNIIQYRNAMTKDYDKITINETLMTDKDLKVFSFLENLVKINKFDNDEYDLLIYEMENIKDILNQSNSIKDKHICKIYFENGILLPVKIYLNKIFSVVMNMSGKEFLKIYEMCYHILTMKKFILENGFYNEENGNNFSNNKSVINSQKFNQQELENVNKDLKKITDTKFQALNYYQIHEIVSKHIMSLIQNPTSKDLANFFQQYEENQKLDFHNLFQNFDITLLKSAESIFKLISDYIDQKNDFENSCIKINLNEIHLDLEISFRTVIIKFLFFMTNNEKSDKMNETSDKMNEISNLMNENNQNETFSKMSHEIILKLLINDTKMTQNSIEEIIDEINLSQMAESIFKNLLSIIFSQYNPTTFELSEDYYTSCHLVKIFKFLCEEHNNFFQNIFLQKLNFKIGEFQKIYFYDMIILILDKFLLLSGWDRIKGSDDSNVDYFYALFSCIVEMLIEIVQGTNEENFVLLLKDEYKVMNENNYNKNEKKLFYKFDPLFDSGKALPILFNNIKTLIFNDYATMETIFKVRKELVDLLLSFLEEHSCPKKIKFLIMTNYHPKNILKSIGNALKTYYIKNCNSHNKNSDEIVVENFLNYSKTKVNLVNSPTNNILNSETNINGNCNKNLFIDKTLKESKKTKKDKRLKNLKFTETLFNFFTDLYFNDEDFSKSAEFEFCSQFYNYFKLTVLQYKYDEAVQFYEKIRNLPEEEIRNYNKKNIQIFSYNNIQPDNKTKPIIDESDFETFYVIRFFEQISKSVRIRLENINEPILVVYTMSPLLRYLSPNSKEEFGDKVNRENRYTKLSALMEETLYFKLEIDHNWNKIRLNKFYKFGMTCNYYMIGLIIYSLVVMINLVFLAVLRNADDLSSIGNDHIIEILQYFSIVLMIVDVFFIIIWSITKLPLNYIIEKEKYIEKLKIMGKDESDLTILNRIDILINKAIIGRNEINTFIWLFIFVLAGSINKNLIFLYSFALLTVMSLSTTLNNIALSLVLKKGQLIWTAIFMCIILYVYSAWAFFYIWDRFIDWKHREDVSLINLFF